MFKGLDAIPWKNLTHAYGSAEDVPSKIRAMETAPAGWDRESPLWDLMGTICHQGTIYEATAYAVPFLLELVANPRTPDRVGILLLLSDIARGQSYRAVHGNRRNEINFERKLAIEHDWVSSADRAVGAGFETLISLTSEDGEVRLAAAHVLAQLAGAFPTVRPLFRELLSLEPRSLYRAGYLLLIGQSNDRSEEAGAILLAALQSGDKTQCCAAVFSIAHLKPTPLPEIAKAAILEAQLSENMDETFRGLPWDVWGEIDEEELQTCVDETENTDAIIRLIVSIETGKGTNNLIRKLLGRLFPQAKAGANTPLTAKQLSSLQARAVRAIAPNAEKRTGVALQEFLQWRLPDTRIGWRNLVEGREPEPGDPTLPIIADVNNPKQALQINRLNVGDRILHRKLGAGTVRTISCSGAFTTLDIDFDEEGSRRLMFRSDGSAPRGKK